VAGFLTRTTPGLASLGWWIQDLALSDDVVHATRSALPARVGASDTLRSDDAFLPATVETNLLSVATALVRAWPRLTLQVAWLRNRKASSRAAPRQHAH
jgi:hypothetical protein